MEWFLISIAQNVFFFFSFQPSSFRYPCHHHVVVVVFVVLITYSCNTHSYLLNFSTWMNLFNVWKAITNAYHTHISTVYTFSRCRQIYFVWHIRRVSFIEHLEKVIIKKMKSNCMKHNRINKHISQKTQTEWVE